MMAGLERCYQSSGQGIRLFIKVQPGARREEIKGIAEDAPHARLVIATTAAPDQGKANRAVIRWLAKKLGVAPSSIALEKGDASRKKTLFIAGDAARLARALQAAAAS